MSLSWISQLKLDADWVVLSACNTAAPDGRRYRFTALTWFCATPLPWSYSTPRLSGDTPVPEWAARYLHAMQRIADLHAEFVCQISPAARTRGKAMNLDYTYKYAYI